MKKWVLCVLALALSLGVCRAQLGVVAGLTSSRPDLASAVQDAYNINLYHVGVTQKIPLVMGFVLQPSILFNVKGSCLGTVKPTVDALAAGLNSGFQADMRTGYLEVPLQIQWGPNYESFRPYVFAEPFLGYALSNSVRVESSVEQTWDNIRSRFEYGIGLGGGIELFDHLQLSVRYFWNLGYVYEDTITLDYAFQVVTQTIAKNRANGISASVAFLF